MEGIFSRLAGAVAGRPRPREWVTGAGRVRTGVHETFRCREPLGVLRDDSRPRICQSGSTSG